MNEEKRYVYIFVGTGKHILTSANSLP